MTTETLRDALITVLTEMPHSDDRMQDIPGELFEVRRVRSFNDAGVMSSDAGIVLTAKDGSEFQITVVRSK